MTRRLLVLFCVGLAFCASACAQNEKNAAPGETARAIAPDFTLTGNDDKEVTLSKVGKTTVVVFFRGHW